MKRLLSLFDYSGQWSQPFYEGGWDVIQWDIKLSDFMDINKIDTAETALELFEDIDGIIAAPPCTEFTVSCNRLWGIKDEDGRTEKALELVRQVARLADLFEPTCPDYIEEVGDHFFWAVENPVGRMGSLMNWPKPFYFDPYQYAGYTEPDYRQLRVLEHARSKNGHNLTAHEIMTVIDTNAYTKKTGLWGKFIPPTDFKPIPPVKCSPHGSWTTRLGGKSEKTKELRSITPYGFAKAFYLANDY